MTWKTRKRLSKLIILLIFFSFTSYHFGGKIYNKTIHEPICKRTVTNAGILSIVRSIEYTIPETKNEKPYTVVIGYDKSGNEIAVWLDFKNNYFKPTIYHKTNLDKNISRNEAISIVMDNGLLAHIPDISVAYIEKSTSYLKKGLYWSMFDNNGKLVYVNMSNGTYLLSDYKRKSIH
ncbi:hypothetical protein SH2C18_38100 [Clostridium sediminicola]|uniref:hypothetical protein n=1 Tax=Clostridium sediminicola TaxID=3114879 RepID=UPI0031F220F1